MTRFAAIALSCALVLQLAAMPCVHECHRARQASATGQMTGHPCHQHAAGGPRSASLHDSGCQHDDSDRTGIGMVSSSARQAGKTTMLSTMVVEGVSLIADATRAHDLSRPGSVSPPSSSALVSLPLRI